MAHVSVLRWGNHCSRERCSVESAALSALFSATASGDVCDLHIKDLVVAVCEDVIAVGLALFLVSR